MQDSYSVSMKGGKLFRKKKTINLILNLVIVWMGISSLFIKFFIVDGVLAFRAFTVDGNLFTTLVTILAVIINISELVKKKENNSRFMYFLILSSAVTEAVIFIVVMIGYLPFVPDNPAVTPYHMFCLHVGIPVLAVFRFIFFEKPVGVLKPVKLLIGAIPIGVYGLFVTIAIKGGVLPIVLVPYSFLDIENNFIWYFLFALFVIPSFGYLWSWLFYRLNIRASVLWFNKTDLKNLEEARKQSLHRFDVVNSSILLVFCMLCVLLLSFSLMLTSRTSTKIQHELLATTSYLLIDDYDKRMGDGQWHIKDGALYKDNYLVGDGTEENTTDYIIPEDMLVFETSMFVKASDLSPEVAAKYDKDDYVSVVNTGGKTGPVTEVGETLDRNVRDGVLKSKDHIYYDQIVVEKKITDPLYKSDARKYFEEEKKERVKYYHFCMEFGSSMDNEGVGIITMSIPVNQITAQAKKAEMNTDIAMTVMILLIFAVLYILTYFWIRGLERSVTYLRELADDRVPEEPLHLGKGKRMSGLAMEINEIRKRKIKKENEK